MIYYFLIAFGVATGALLLPRTWLLALASAFFSFRTTWRNNKRRACRSRAARINFGRLRAHVALISRDNGHCTDVTELYNCLVDQDILSTHQLNWRDGADIQRNTSVVYVQFAAPFDGLDQKITCSTEMAEVRFCGNVIASYRLGSVADEE